MHKKTTHKNQTHTKNAHILGTAIVVIDGRTTEIDGDQQKSVVQKNA